MRKNNYQEDEPEQRGGSSIEDEMVYGRLEAFMRTYQPVMSECEAHEVFNTVRLRAYFQAWPTGAGDLLPYYMNHLVQEGYQMITSISGESVIPVRTSAYR